ncbi:MAG: topoisomerase protein [Microgenomates group bacterium GW2011_GWF2_45_18]|nr:MAG: topoisomerase protein [Microgenomates group bacterium GW2011_GWF1_44_10]KKU01369.1 MAG: topoisomerase protein [Microgenomates group bacterium GW2011_GWF2_45_18]
MHLVLVESPTKAKKLAQYLGAEYDVHASMGHVRDLPPSKMGVDVDHDFEPEYEITSGRKSLVADLKKRASTSDIVYLATDPDREGEAIAWHLQALLEPKKSKVKFVRSTFHEITKEAVLAAINAPAEINMDLVNAQQARRVVDRLVGYYVSPVLWKKIRRGLSAGRVQSVALRLIVEREKEILAFKPEEYWEVDVLLRSLSSEAKQEFLARVSAVDKKPFDPKSKDDVDPILDHLKTASYVVHAVEKNDRRRSAYPPFTTSTLQQACANRFGWSSKQTMMVAQSLYEEGLITYHRTDSFALSQQAIDAIRSTVDSEYGKQYLPDKPNYYKKSSKNAQEAHEAIRPTVYSENDLKKAQLDLDDKQSKLLALVRNRAVASQMNDAIFAQTLVEIHATTTSSSKIVTLKANGSILQFDGWYKAYAQTSDTTELPNLQEKESLEYRKTQAEQKFTQPPARFNDASLVKTLEKLGIGRPSTYASIISVISDRGYVERKEKAFIPTSIGTTVSDFLVKNFPKELDYQFTAEMEDDLDAIARGEKQWKKIVRVFFEPFQKTVDEVTKTGERAKIPVEDTGEKCPTCGEGNVVVRTGRFGKFLSCARYPECKYTARLVQTVDGMKCPDCNEGDVVYKRTKRGRGFYGCSRYPSCNFASWQKPTPVGGK